MAKYKGADGVEIEVSEGSTPPEGSTLVATPPVVVAPVVPPPAASTSGTPPEAGTTVKVDGKTVIMPTAALGRIKKEERARGMKDRDLELAKQYGFSTTAEMDAAMKGFRAAPPASAQPGAVVPPPVVKPVSDPGAPPAGMSAAGQAAWESERAAMVAENETLKASAKASKKAAERAAQRAQDVETRASLEKQALSAGLVDTDYAIHLLTQHVDGQTEEQLAAFDPATFFVGLKTQKPHLFIAPTTPPAPTPATTGVSGAPPKAPGAADITGASGTNARVDARTMTRAEFEALKKKRGLNPSSVQ